MKTRTEAAKAAALIRKELKKNGIAATVRSENYSGGSSVRVTIKQDILPATYAKVETYCNQYQYGHFDGMQDLYEYTNSRDDLPQVKFVFVNLEYSQELKDAAWDHCHHYYADCSEFETRDQVDYQADNTYRSVLDGSGDHGGFWRQYKAHVTLGNSGKT